MPSSGTINNPNAAWSAGATYAPPPTTTDSQVVVIGVNNSGGTLHTGDVVIIDVTGCLFTTTTTAGDLAVYGVALPRSGDGLADDTYDAYASLDVMRVCIEGVARVNIASNTVALKDLLTASSAAKVAVTNNSATIGEVIAVALEASSAKDSNNLIRALIGKM